MTEELSNEGIRSQMNTKYVIPVERRGVYWGSTDRIDIKKISQEEENVLITEWFGRAGKDGREKDARCQGFAFCEMEELFKAVRPSLFF